MEPCPIIKLRSNTTTWVNLTHKMWRDRSQIQKLLLITPFTGKSKQMKLISSAANLDSSEGVGGISG